MLAGRLQGRQHFLGPLSRIAAQEGLRVAYLAGHQPPRDFNEGGRFESGPLPEEIQKLADEIVLDGFPYQVLSEGHLRRLGHNLGRHDPSVEINSLLGGRTELSIGGLSSWLPDHPKRPGVQAAARELLAPCLLATATAARELAEVKRSSNAVEGIP